jgi:hypothetical protein
MHELAYTDIEPYFASQFMHVPESGEKYSVGLHYYWKFRIARTFVTFDVTKVIGSVCCST